MWIIIIIPWQYCIQKDSLICKRHTVKNIQAKNIFLSHLKAKQHLSVNNEKSNITEITTRAFNGILQSTELSYQFFSKYKGRILDKLRASFTQKIVIKTFKESYRNIGIHNTLSLYWNNLRFSIIIIFKIISLHINHLKCQLRSDYQSHAITFVHPDTIINK